MKENEKSEDVLPEAEASLDRVASAPKPEPEPEPKVKSKAKKTAKQDDQWSRSGPIPSGATGPTVSKVRVALGLKAEGSLDRSASLKVRSFQRDAGLQLTGFVDVETRRALNV